MQTKAQATVAGKALLKRMKGKGWKLRVWNNCGWHYSVQNANVNVNPSHEGKFFCMLSDAIGDVSSPMIWSTNFHSKDPNRTVLHDVRHARKVVDKLDKAVSRIEKVMGLKCQRR